MADEWYEVKGVDTRKFSPTTKGEKRRKRGKRLGTAMRNWASSEHGAKRKDALRGGPS